MTGLRRVEFHPKAAAEAKAPYVWYRERSVAAADAFLAQLDRAIARVVEHPERQPDLGDGVRRFNLPRFPFALIYRTDDDKVQVVAIAHGRRRPGYWRTR